MAKPMGAGSGGISFLRITRLPQLLGAEDLEIGHNCTGGGGKVTKILFSFLASFSCFKYLPSALCLTIRIFYLINVIKVIRNLI